MLSIPERKVERIVTYLVRGVAIGSRELFASWALRRVDTGGRSGSWSCRARPERGRRRLGRAGARRIARFASSFKLLQVLLRETVFALSEVIQILPRVDTGLMEVIKPKPATG